MRTVRGSLIAMSFLSTSLFASPLMAQGRGGPAPAPVAPPKAGPATSTRVILEYDQSTGTLRRDPASNSNLIEFVSADTIRLKKAAWVQLRVINTNTALYDLTVSDTVVPLPPSAASGGVAGFLNAAHSYFPMLLGGAMRATRGVRRDEERKSMWPDAAPAPATDNMNRTLEVAHMMERHLWAADSLFAGPQSISHFHSHARAALLRMRDSSARPETIAAEFRDSIGLARGEACRATPGDTLGLSRRLLSHHDALRPLSDSLARGLSDPVFADHQGLRDSLVAFRMRADSSIRAAEILADSAAATERLVTVITGACSHWEAQPQGGIATSSIGRKIMLRISQRSDLDVERIGRGASRAPVNVVVLPPKPLVTPSFGLTLLGATNANFPTYSTRTPATGGQVEIFQQGTQDSRFSWGATLGLNFRFMNAGKLSFWAPELTVTQSQGTTGFGAGTALAFGPVKVGTGLLWIQHQALRDQEVGQKLPNKDFLQTKTTYGTGSFYVSFSIFGVPGFVAK